MSEASRGRYRSLFWPLVLIGVGVVWLLGNLGLISGANLAVLFRLWPLLLIAIGLDLLFGRQSPAVGALIGVGTVIVVIALMLVGPGLGLAGNYQVRATSFSEPLGDAQSARVNLDLSVGSNTIEALADSRNLFEADLTYIGEVDFQSGGEREKVISLSQQGQNLSWGPFDFFNWIGSTDQLRWEIGLSPEVPLDLTINGGVGSSRIDLSGLEISGLSVSAGVGDVTLTLPAMTRPYTARLNGGVSNFTVIVPEDASVDLEVEGGVGNFIIDAPDSAAVRLEANVGIGNVSVPDRLARVGGGEDDDGLGDQGVWETEGYSRAERRIQIRFEGGVGGLTVR